MVKENKFDFSQGIERTAPSFWNFKVNPVVEGILKEIMKEENDRGEEIQQLKITVADGSDVLIGSYTTLEGVFNEKDLNRPVKIEYVGETASKVKGHKPYMNFKVTVI